jgi:hypothetical protein
MSLKCGLKRLKGGMELGAVIYSMLVTPRSIRWSRNFWDTISGGPYLNKPEIGQTLRIYLARNAYDGATNENNDGGFNVIYSNGFEKLTDEAK